MAVSITVQGGQLKIDKGVDPVYYPLGDLRVKVDDSESTIILLEDGKIVDSWLYSDITAPVAATLELMADAIADLLDNASGSTTITGTVTTKEVTSATATLSNVTASATSVQVLASNPNRKLAVLMNDSISVAYVKFGTTASATDFTYKILANDTLDFTGVEYTGRVDAIWISATGTMRITETSE